NRKDRPVKIRIPHLYSDLQKSIHRLKQDKAPVRLARRRVEQAFDRDEPMYGINTGFGALANKRINDEQLEQLQRNLILSHAVGVGDLIPKEMSKLMLQLKIHALGLGYSGVSEDTFDRLVYFSEHDLIPAMPEKGSVGASGDLAPLAHMALPLLGYGVFWN